MRVPVGPRMTVGREGESLGLSTPCGGFFREGGAREHPRSPEEALASGTEDLGIGVPDV